jgi:hypothetical protein
MTTVSQNAVRRVTYQLETLWDYDYIPTHEELDMLYETAKKNQWNGSTAIDWTRPIGKEGPVLNVQVAFAGTNFFSRLTAEEQKEVEIRVSAWRLSQFLHGEQGALMCASKIVNTVPTIDAKFFEVEQARDPDARYPDVRSLRDVDKTMLAKVSDTSRYGTVEMDAGGRITAFIEKRPESTAGYINAGVYLLRRPMLDQFGKDRPCIKLSNHKTSYHHNSQLTVKQRNIVHEFTL